MLTQSGSYNDNNHILMTQSANYTTSAKLSNYGDNVYLFNNPNFTSGSYATGMYSLKALNLNISTEYNTVQVLTVYNTNTSSSIDIYADISGNLYTDQSKSTNFNTSGITSSSTNFLVSQWWDQSGNNNHAVQDLYMNRPYINTGGLNGAYQICFPYTGSGPLTGLICPDTTFCSPSSSFTVVINHNGILRNDSSHTCAFFSTTNNVIAYKSSQNYGYFALYKLQIDSFQTNVFYNSNNFTGNHKTIASFTHTSTGNDKFYLNGSLPTITYYYDQPMTAIPNQSGRSTDNSTPNGTYIGASGGANNDRNGPLDGELYSLFVFVGSSLTDIQRRIVESYA